MKSGELATPELGDTILPGITRKSVIELARAQGVKVSERKIAIGEVLSDVKEVFFTGTAAGVSFVESVTHLGKTAKFGAKPGELTTRLARELKGIQYGAVADGRGWMVQFLIGQPVDHSIRGAGNPAPFLCAGAGPGTGSATLRAAPLTPASAADAKATAGTVRTTARLPVRDWTSSIAIAFELSIWYRECSSE